MEASPIGVRPFGSLVFLVLLRRQIFLLPFVLEFCLESVVEGRTLAVVLPPLPPPTVAQRCCLQVGRVPPVGHSAGRNLEGGIRRASKCAFCHGPLSSIKKCWASNRNCSAVSRIQSWNHITERSTSLGGIPHFYRWLCAQYPSIVKPLRRVLFRYPVCKTGASPKISPKLARRDIKEGGSCSSRESCFYSSSSVNRPSTNVESDAAQNVVFESSGELEEQKDTNTQQAKILKRLEFDEERLLEEEFSAAVPRQRNVRKPASSRHRQKSYQNYVPFLVGSSSSATAVPVDALLVDFNAVIHLCTHGHLPSFLPSPLLQQQPQLLVRTCSYLDKLVKLIQPRKALVVTLDGVPPLAKLSQQRGRRFRHHLEQLKQQQEPLLQLIASSQKRSRRKSTQEAAPLQGTSPTGAINVPVSTETENLSNQNFSGQKCSGEDEGSERRSQAEADSGDRTARFDSNCIGPGTRFMFLVQQTLRKFIAQKQRTSTTWRRMESVVLSGADCPGEGEHKLMRLLKMFSFDDYDPDLSDQWSSEMHTHEPKETPIRRLSRPARAKFLLPPAYTDVQSGPQKESLSTNMLGRYIHREGCERSHNALWPAHVQEQQLLNEKGDQILVPIPGRICLYGMDADLLILCLALHRPGVYILREKQRALSETRAETAKAALKKVEAKHNEKAVEVGDEQMQNGASACQSEAFQRSLLDQVSEMGLQLPGGSDFLHYKSADFELVDVDELRSQLTTTLQSAVRTEARKLLRMSGEGAPALKRRFQELPMDFVKLCSTCKAVPPGRLLDDFVLLSFFVGNDFLPSLPHIDIFQGGLGALIQVYTEALPLLGGPLTLKDKIHIPRLLRFFELLSRGEPAHFQSSDAPGPVADYAAKYYASKFPLRQFLESEMLSPKEGDDSEGVAFAAFRRNLCHRYISGLFFLLQYYHSNVPSWTWSFPYHYAPLASDLAAVRHDDLRVSLPLSWPLSPYHQLLAVLPPSSSHLLPRAYQRVHDSCRSGVGKALEELHALFPNKFEIDPHPLEAIPYPGKSAELITGNLGSDTEGQKGAGVSSEASTGTEATARPNVNSKFEYKNDIATLDINANTRAALAIEAGKEALLLALANEPRRGMSALPEWLHRPLIPFVDLPTLKAGAREAVDAEKAAANEQEDLKMARSSSDMAANRKEIWRPEDIFRNRLGRTHIFVSPSLQQRWQRSEGSECPRRRK